MAMNVHKHPQGAPDGSRSDDTEELASVAKALGLLGLGRERVERGDPDGDPHPRMIASDRTCARPRRANRGYLPAS